MFEFLQAYKGVEPANLDAFAWAGIVGGNLVKDNQQTNTEYLTHFLDKDVGDNPDENEKIHKAFTDLVTHNKASLKEDNIEFLLPNDDTALKERLRTLALWCESFVSALGTSSYLKDKTLASKVNSHIHDLIEMSKMDTSSSDDYDNPEAANIDYMEIYEFLRATVISLDLEFSHFTSH